MTRTESFKTMTLFAVPSFWSGFARVLDLGGTFDVYNDNNTEQEADCQALLSDWKQVGEDMSYVMERYRHVQK